MNKNTIKKGNIAKECAYVSVFVALLIAVQSVLSMIPVELVTALFISYCFTFGVKRGMLSATVFTFVRQLVFGFFPTVFILYLVYFNFLAWLFGYLGTKINHPLKSLAVITFISCVCTFLFSMLDNILTPLFYAYSQEATKAYFIASFSFTLPQIIGTAVSVSVLFFPLHKAFYFAKKQL